MPEAVLFNVDIVGDHATIVMVQVSETVEGSVLRVVEEAEFGLLR